MTRPNILWLQSDQHNPGFLGCAGEPLVRTPRLDALAAAGVRCADVTCGNPLCVPSRMTMLTARHSSDIAVWTNECQLAGGAATFIHHLANAGYQTVLCGRMHFTGPDQRRGYESRILGDVDPKLEFIPAATTGQTAAGVRPAGPGRTAYGAFDEAVTATACRWLAERATCDEARPFFLTVGYVLPHCPYICPKPLFDYYRERVEVPALPADYFDRLHPALAQWRLRRGVDTLTDDEVLTARAAYYGLVTQLDDLVGRVLDALAATRFERDTLVVYTSDHGDMAGHQRMWWKSSLYQGSVGVPMIWRWPGHLPAGQVVPQVASLLDLGPTLVDFAGGEPMRHVSGRSLRPLLEGHQTSWDETALAEYGGLLGDRPARLIRQGPWKLVHHHGYARPQLFNLAADPGEWDDRASDPTCASIRDELLARVHEGYDGAAVETAVARVRADREVLRTWQRTARPAPTNSPDRWTAPDGCNLWPER